MSQDSHRTAAVTTVAARGCVATDRPCPTCRRTTAVRITAVRMIATREAAVGAARVRTHLRPSVDTLPGARRTLSTERNHR